MNPEEFFAQLLMAALRNPKEDAVDAQKAHLDRTATADWTASRKVIIRVGEATLVLTNTGNGEIKDVKGMRDFDVRTVAREHILVFNGYIELPVIGRVDLEQSNVIYTADVNFDWSSVEGLPDVEHRMTAVFAYTVNGERREIKIGTNGYAWPMVETETVEAHWCPVCQEVHPESVKQVYTCTTEANAYLDSPTGRVHLKDHMVTLS